jgi:HPt (histidine-containing phosphotransfer) domain-containing protein
MCAEMSLQVDEICTSRPAAAPIDRVHLGRYTLGDSALEREILGLFLAQIPLTIVSMRYAASDREWQMAAHTLKGSGRAIGAWEIARLGQEAEKLGGIGDREACTAVIGSIEDAASEVEAYYSAAFPD